MAAMAGSARAAPGLDHREAVRSHQLGQRHPCDRHEIHPPPPPYLSAHQQTITHPATLVVATATHTHTHPHHNLSTTTGRRRAANCSPAIRVDHQVPPPLLKPPARKRSNSRASSAEAGQLDETPEGSPRRSSSRRNILHSLQTLGGQSSTDGRPRCTTSSMHLYGTNSFQQPNNAGVTGWTAPLDYTLTYPVDYPPVSYALPGGQRQSHQSHSRQRCEPQHAHEISTKPKYDFGKGNRTIRLHELVIRQQ